MIPQTVTLKGIIMIWYTKKVQCSYMYNFKTAFSTGLPSCGYSQTFE